MIEESQSIEDARQERLELVEELKSKAPLVVSSLPMPEVDDTGYGDCTYTVVIGGLVGVYFKPEKAHYWIKLEDLITSQLKFIKSKIVDLDFQ